MPHINLLSSHVADLIAAGEVVERPASVIKELMENAFDAGADQITVEIRDGGATMIRVTDNGCGMAPEDAGIAFLRHATSKLSDERGLEAIQTMGFRGEALAAISAVSRVELLTRRPEDVEGTRMTLEAGDIQDMEPAGCPSGTSICVRDLFYNTPARLKFLKSDRSEASACVQAALRCALGRPEISVRFLKDSSEVFFTPGDGRADACAYALLGRELTADFLPVCSTDGDIQLTGYVSSPAAGRGNRSAQFFYCNGRYIRSAQLQSALEQAYRNTLLTGRYPACVLYLELRPGSVDVNVHPAKVEVKFSEEKRIFSLVFQAVRDSLEQESRSASGLPSGSVHTLSPEQRQEAVPASETRSSGREEGPRTALPFRAENVHAGTAYPASGADIALQHSLFSPAAVYPVQKSPAQGGDDGAELPRAEQAVEKPVQNVDNPEGQNHKILYKQDLSADADDSAVPEHKILGEAFKTYLAVDVDDHILLIDKHAAHERMNFDRLKAQSQPSPAQQLLTPRTVRFDGRDMALLEEYGELFSEFGFEIEPFGENACILRAVPADILPDDAVPAMEEILQRLGEGAAPDPASARDELLHTVACKAAIKAGWNTGKEELETLACAVLSGRVKYCPHGRPVSAVISRKDLEKLFLRIV